MASVLFLYLRRTYQWNFSNKIQVPYLHNFKCFWEKKQALSKISFYQQNTISLDSCFLLVLSCNIFLMTFHGSIFLNIKLGPTTTSSPRRRGHGLHNPDSSHDQIRCSWLAEVRNLTNIMIECLTNNMQVCPWSKGHCTLIIISHRLNVPDFTGKITEW